MRSSSERTLTCWETCWSPLAGGDCYSTCSRPPATLGAGTQRSARACTPPTLHSCDMIQSIVERHTHAEITAVIFQVAKPFFAAPSIAACQFRI